MEYDQPISTASDISVEILYRVHKFILVRVRRDATVLSLKQAIEDRNGMNPDAMNLVYVRPPDSTWMTLRERDTLEQMGISDHSVVRLRPPNRGDLNTYRISPKRIVFPRPTWTWKTNDPGMRPIQRHAIHIVHDIVHAFYSFVLGMHRRVGKNSRVSLLGPFLLEMIFNALKVIARREAFEEIAWLSDVRFNMTLIMMNRRNLEFDGLHNELIGHNKRLSLFWHVEGGCEFIFV